MSENFLLCVNHWKYIYKYIYCYLQPHKFICLVFHANPIQRSWESGNRSCFALLCWVLLPLWPQLFILSFPWWASWPVLVSRACEYFTSCGRRILQTLSGERLLRWRVIPGHLGEHSATRKLLGEIKDCKGVRERAGPGHRGHEIKVIWEDIERTHDDRLLEGGRGKGMGSLLE